MQYEIDLDKGDKALFDKIIKKIQSYEISCVKKNEQSSPTKVKEMIEEMCREN